MFPVSGPEMVSAATRAGILGCLAAANARGSEIPGRSLQQIGAVARSHPDAAGAISGPPDRVSE